MIKFLNILANDLKNQSSYSMKYLLDKNKMKDFNKKGIKIRKMLSPFLREIYKYQTDYKLVIDKREKNNKNCAKLFITNHRQADDIVNGARLINESAYFVFGNKYLAFDTINGFGLYATGVIMLDRDDKESREMTSLFAKSVLTNGGNVIVKGEGYWNLADDGETAISNGKVKEADYHNSKTWLLQDLNVGLIKLAIELSKNQEIEIVPGVLHYDETGKKVCYGRLMSPIKLDPSLDPFEVKDIIWQTMVDNYYDLMEKYSSYKREDIEQTKPLKQQWEELIEQLIRDCDIPRTGYKLDLNDEKVIGKAKVVKPVITNKEAFKDNFEINKHNAFLLERKR